MTPAEVRMRIAAARAEARRRVPEWRPWMRQWCLVTSWGARRDAADHLVPGAVITVRQAGTP